MKKKNIIISIFLIFLSVAPLIATIVIYKDLPNTIPVHFNLRGDVDRWGSKIELFLMPIIILFVGISSLFSIVFDKKINSQFVRKIPSFLGIVLMIILNIISGVILYVSYLGLESLY